VIRIQNKQMYDSHGEWLKEIHCPKKMTQTSLVSKSDNTLHCAECSKTIVETGNMTEEALTAMLKTDSNICLKINVNNPIFELIK